MMQNTTPQELRDTFASVIESGLETCERLVTESRLDLYLQLLEIMTSAMEQLNRYDAAPPNLSGLAHSFAAAAINPARKIPNVFPQIGTPTRESSDQEKLEIIQRLMKSTAKVLSVIAEQAEMQAQPPLSLSMALPAATAAQAPKLAPRTRNS